MKFSLLLALALLFLSDLAFGQAKDHPSRDDMKGIAAEDKEMQAAYEKARETLRDFIAKLEAREEDHRYLIKVRLEEGEHVEHVWLEPVKWNSPGLIGVLASQPGHITKVKKGDVIKPLPKEVSDWLILKPDGSKQGGFTVDVVKKRSSE